MRPKILVVDDESDMRTLLSVFLEANECQPVTAGNGMEGMRALEETPADLIILDVMMPGEDGVKMYQRVKTDPAYRHIPVIILSAISKKTFQHYIKVAGDQSAVTLPPPEAYMEKPPEMDDLLALIKSLTP